MIKQIPSEKNDSNCYFIEENGHVIIVDPSCGDKIRKILRENSWIPDYIFLTHEHFDHITSLEEIRKEWKIPVVACELCSERVQNHSSNLSSIADILEFFRTGEEPKEKKSRFVCSAADMTYKETWTMEWRGHSFRFRRIPGHSPGSVLIVMDDDVYFTGDYLIWQEEEITRLRGGSQEDYENIARPALESIPIGKQLYPGHGISYKKGME